MIQQSRPPVPVTLRTSPIPPGRGRMVPSCYTKNSRRGGLSLAAAIQRGEALRKETLLEQLLGIHPGNQFATASHYHGPRFQYKEQSNYSTAQGLAYRQLIPHTRMYEYTSLRAPILGLGRRLMCRINNRYPTSLLFGPVGKNHPGTITPMRPLPSANGTLSHLAVQRKGG